MMVRVRQRMYFIFFVLLFILSALILLSLTDLSLVNKIIKYDKTRIRIKYDEQW
jgi:hypothetical protein